MKITMKKIFFIALYLAASLQGSKSETVVRRKRRNDVEIPDLDAYFRNLDEQRQTSTLILPLNDMDTNFAATQFSFALTTFPTVSPAFGPSLAPTIATTLAPAGTVAPGTSSPPTMLRPSPDCTQLDRESATMKELGRITPESQLSDSSTPQGMALQWIVSTSLDPCADVATTRQRFVLATLYFSTGGDTWSNNTNWLSDGNECEWAGVSCHETQDVASGLILSENNLVGELPEEIGALTVLETFEAYSNNLEGSIPESVADLQLLTTFDVEQNGLSGNPFEVAKDLPNLTRLRLSSNMFSGEIDGASLENLDGLEELWIGRNAFKGSIPSEIGLLTSLDTLYVNGNEITGTVPTEIGNLRLKGFLAHGLMLEGDLPSGLFMSTDLTTLRLDGNNFSGPLDDAIGGMTQLTDIRLNDNALTGSLPNSLWQLSQLELLSLGDNNFTGTLQDNFDGFDDLDTFDVSNNQFSGTIPSTLFDTENIRLVYFSNNNFTGSIPNTYGNAPFLRDLYFDGNQLEGTVPSVEAGQWSELTELLFQNNNLTGSMPASVCSLRNSVPDNPGMLEDLWADCHVIDGKAKLFCACCTQCIFSS